MIISTAPLRLSYLGGGTDYEMYSKEYGGKVIGSTINKKVYVFINELSPIAEENIRFTYILALAIQVNSPAALVS